MSINVKPFLATTFTACALLLAGCTTYEQPRSLPAPSQPQAPRTAVDGQWLDKDGIISSFSAGRFETRTTDSNQVLAVGSYIVNGNVVEIDVTSVLRQTRSRVNCAIAAPYLLNCTPSQGARFSLYKPAAAPVGFTLDDAAAMTANASGQPISPGSTMPSQQMGATQPQMRSQTYSPAYPAATSPGVNFSGLQSSSDY
ncbi:hypothetical protein [Martelella lutilitoris]|uniref:hypothetical protein n=1 Tax=Martelella lutilitoris TaxID=2583532 RepID=UPI001FEA4DD1|nr:hypothetical protein [Martelella lutilitoris]